MGVEKNFYFSMSFLIPKKQKGVKKMQNKKVIFINEFDVSILDRFLSCTFKKHSKT